MVPGLGPKREHASNHDQPKTPIGGLSGWAGIEDHLMQNDTGMVKDYADDIDTLLVFAGLFSAVLTAFVVETYTLLVPDNSDTTNQILTNGFSSLINGTAASPYTPPPFTPPTSARWINALFFISLVFSLAAAFFGILAKQWLREYMRWNSPLAAPRENVLVRQIHFEAWEAWNVAATISTIPALLESAMILFLVGIDILLWTIDNVTAIVVTVVVVAFLGAASAFTVLPVFFKRCPYKSPTAWACVVAVEVISAPFIHFYKLCVGLLNGLLRDYKRIGRRHPWPTLSRDEISWIMEKIPWPYRSKTWRGRDIEGLKVTKLRPNCWWSKSVIARKVAKTMIAQEGMNINEHGGMTSNVWAVGNSVHPDEDKFADALLWDIGQTGLLLRALTWVRIASQDTCVKAYIDTCLDTIHPDTVSTRLDMAAQTSMEQTQTQLLASWCILLSLNRLGGSDLDQLYQPLLDTPLLEELDLITSIPSVNSLRQCLGVRVRPTNLPTLLADHTIFSRQDYSAGALQVYLSSEDSFARPLVYRMLLAQLRSAIKVLETIYDIQDSYQVPIFNHVRRIAELFSVVENARSIWRDSLHDTSWGDRISSILGSVAIKDTLDDLVPELCKHAFEVATLHGSIMIHPVNKSFVIYDGIPMSSLDYELLLTQFNGEFLRCSKDDLEMFLFSAYEWIQHHGRLDSTSGSRQILCKIADTITAVSSRNYGQHCRTTRTRLNPYWVMSLQYILNQERGWLKEHGPEMLHILHALETAHSDRSLPSWEHLRRGTGRWLIKEYLHSCLEMVHKTSPSCDHPNYAWISHSCDGWQKCPLLRFEMESVALPPLPIESTSDISKAVDHFPPSTAIRAQVPPTLSDLGVVLVPAADQAVHQDPGDTRTAVLEPISGSSRSTNGD